MFYATMMMHKPEDKPKHIQNILILIKGHGNFKVGGYIDHSYYVSGEMQDDLVKTDNIEMWCEIPTRDTIHKVNGL